LPIKTPPPFSDVEFDYRLPEGPFVYERQVRWGDTDPAQIAYTATLPAMCLEAIESFVKACIGVNWYEGNLDHGFGMPFAHMDCDFFSPVDGREPLLLSVYVERVGRTSLTTRVVGHQDGRHCLAGTYVNVFARSDVMQPVEIPPNVRANLTRYQEAQER